MRTPPQLEARRATTVERGMPPADDTNPVAYVGIENHEGEGAQKRSMSQLLSVLLNIKVVVFLPRAVCLGIMVCSTSEGDVHLSL